MTRAGHHSLNNSHPHEASDSYQFIFPGPFEEDLNSIFNLPAYVSKQGPPKSWVG